MAFLGSTKIRINASSSKAFRPVTTGIPVSYTHLYLLKFVPAEDLAEYEAIQSDPLDMVWDNFSVNEIKKKLMIFLEGLSERNRNLFIDAVILGYHYKELSKKYGLTETNISVKIFRFRVRLRKLLEQED